MVIKFGVFCQVCLEKSKPHIVWHEQKAFTLICYNCGIIETIKIEDDCFPKDTEEYDTLVENEKKEIKINADKVVEKKLN